MTLRDYIATYGGLVGLITFALSIILFFSVDVITALVVNTITLLSLNPYHTYQAYWLKQHDLAKVSPIWHGKFGSLISLISLVNLVWYGYLIYEVFDSIILVVITVLFLLFKYPKLLITFMISYDDYER